MTNGKSKHAERIRAVSDAFRWTFVGGAFRIGRRRRPTRRDTAVHPGQGSRIRRLTIDDDIHAEHDVGAIEHYGVRCFWKIDDYDREADAGAVVSLSRRSG